MKKVAVSFAATLMFLTVAMAAPKARTFTGDIMDSACAKAGTHAEMEKMHKMPASDALTGKAARMCTLDCVKMGGKFVLFDPTTKTTYQLDDQHKPTRYAGEKVTIRGTFDQATDTIHVESIRPAS